MYICDTWYICLTIDNAYCCCGNIQNFEFDDKTRLSPYPLAPSDASEFLPNSLYPVNTRPAKSKIGLFDNIERRTAKVNEILSSPPMCTFGLVAPVRRHRMNAII
eukprot:244474_1